jgi:hypothetical protein
VKLGVCKDTKKLFGLAIAPNFARKFDIAYPDAVPEIPYVAILCPSYLFA